jgi:hypothetical protein
MPPAAACIPSAAAAHEVINASLAWFGQVFAKQLPDNPQNQISGFRAAPASA